MPFLSKIWLDSGIVVGLFSLVGEGKSFRTNIYESTDRTIRAARRMIPKYRFFLNLLYIFLIFSIPSDYTLARKNIEQFNIMVK